MLTDIELLWIKVTNKQMVTVNWIESPSGKWEKPPHNHCRATSVRLYGREADINHNSQKAPDSLSGRVSGKKNQDECVKIKTPLSDKNCRVGFMSFPASTRFSSSFQSYCLHLCCFCENLCIQQRYKIRCDQITEKIKYLKQIVKKKKESKSKEQKSQKKKTSYTVCLEKTGKCM